MIDQSKNLCYIVTVSYLVENSEGGLETKHHQFISLHSITTKKCEDFAKQIAKKDKHFYMLPEEGLSQYTVPNADLCK